MAFVVCLSARNKGSLKVFSMLHVFRGSFPYLNQGSKNIGYVRLYELYTLQISDLSYINKKT